MGGVAYTWDNNGNLLNDGTNTYTYNYANRLVSLTDGVNTYAYVYNGLGDRVQQTENGVVTTYQLDLAAGLTQVLSDGTNTYLYGINRIGEEGLTWDYYLGDALGSVRQLTDGNAQVVLGQTYEPYGEVLSSAGDGESSYAYAGEWTDTTGLQYLRARYMNPAVGRFITRDTWAGDYNSPLSLNRWGYVQGNPVMFTDPSGQISYMPYDREAATQYALKYATSINPKYGKMGDSDCTNFVSQAMLAGGFPEDDTWFFEKRGVFGGGCTQSYGTWGPWDLLPNSDPKDLLKPFCGVAWGLTDDLFYYLTEIKGFTPLVADISGDDYPEDTSSYIPTNGKYIQFSSTIQKGDIVFYHQFDTEHVGAGGQFNHAAIVVGWGLPTDKGHPNA